MQKQIPQNITNIDKALDLAADQWFQLLLETFSLTKELPKAIEKKNHA